MPEVEPEIPKLVVYHQTEKRVNWDNPTRQELIDSANAAHSANRKIIENCDQMRAALLVERRNRKRERKWLLRGIIATWTVGGTVIGFLIKFLLPWAVKGMALAK